MNIPNRKRKEIFQASCFICHVIPELIFRENRVMHFSSAWTSSKNKTINCVIKRNDVFCYRCGSKIIFIVLMTLEQL